MTTQISVKIKDFDKIRSGWEKAPEKMSSEIHRAVSKTVMKVEGEAKREAPVNKRSGGGNLRQSIKGQMTGVASGVVEVGVNYAVPVHEGTRPHQIRAKNAKSLANKRTGQFFGRIVNHPGTAANPFLQRAVDNSQGEIDVYFEETVNNLFK